MCRFLKVLVGDTTVLEGSAVVMDGARISPYGELVIRVFYSPPDRKEQLDCEMIGQIKKAVKEPADSNGRF